MSLRLLIVALLAASAIATTHNECENKPAPDDVRVENCSEQPCSILQGSDVIAEVDIVAQKNIKNLEARVRATVFGLTVNYPLPEPDACKSLVDSSCPLEKGDVATYKLVMPISEAIPQVSVNVELSLVDTDSEEVVSCFNIDLKVTK
ncbi:epididymal secretory protein E1-like [Zootermopsis nevadensis]|uniref:Epididymal secretory protein E1 n=1 Tax=Zootermopsis nevadensis TaxID=136037 RepID=A0A067RFH2_ZOONE|nr:epididymal secretory protein E1-like [Zootermopsis nevadensis]KDR21778.1 Epididymal secretory protein E1 [Zootermopsis nevadensis]